MAPIRIGFLGLSSSNSSAWANVAHLPYILASPHYEIVAVSGSTVESAKAAIAAFNLPATTTPYGSAEAIAADPNVDLIVVSVKVTNHYAAVLPALKAGKDVYCEWPLGKNLVEAEELAALAKEKGVKTISGTQGRQTTAAKRVKALLDANAIGRVTGTSVVGAFNLTNPAPEYVGDLALDSKIGGNFLTIMFGHLVDKLCATLGEFSSVHGTLLNHRPTTNIVNSATGEITKRDVPKDTPDQIIVQGILESGAGVSINIRDAPPIKGGKGLSWFINGDDGDLEVTCDNMFLQLNPGSARLFLHTGKDRETTEEISLDDEEEIIGSLGELAKTVGALYQAFAKGEREGYADFGQAAVRHRLVEALAKGEGAYKNTY